MSSTSRSYVIDSLKGLAIIAVIFFHIGLLTFGYLGVEIFLVLAGFLTAKSIIRAFEENKFSYWKFIQNRLVRLWPLAIIICVVSLVLGYFVMLPDNFKNLSETVLGTLSFTNNFIQYITARNYWDVSNDYKPLMHTWYVGILFQFYVVYPLLLVLMHRFTKQWKRSSIILSTCIGFASLILYLLPFIPQPIDFFMLPSRMFEFMLGAVIAFLPYSDSEKSCINKKIIAAIAILSLILATGFDIDQAKIILILTVALTGWILYKTSQTTDVSTGWNIQWLVKIGAASYSIYLWHQVVFAFYRNTISDSFSLWEYVGLISGSIILGFLSFLFVEKPLSSFIKSQKHAKRIILLCCVVSTTFLGYISYKIYVHKGVVRDIPALEIYKDKPETWEPQAYNANVYNYDIDFPSNGKKNILIVGDSYARDWYNILCEAHVNSRMNLSYHDQQDSILNDRIKYADYVFLASSKDMSLFFKYLPKMMRKQFYIIGTKRFFYSPGVIYNSSPKQVEIYDDIVETNKAYAEEFQDSYIDIMAALKTKDDMCLIVTPDNKLISHDGIHLTKAGAKYIASKLDIDSYFKNTSSNR